MDETRVVVGIDGSDAARVALRWAMAEALLWDAPLEVIHAWRTPMVLVPRAYAPELVEMGRMDQAALEFIGKELDAVGADADCGIVIEQTEVASHPAHALIEASRRARLVVVGRHGQGGFPHELVAPKAVQVAHHADCSVAVIPDEWNGDGEGVIVGVDGSEPAAVALRWAMAEAARRHASLTAIMAWGLLDQHHVGRVDTFEPRYGEQDARDALTTYVEHATGLLPDVTVEMTVVNDLAARALTESAERAELLVVGARGLGGFDDLLLGSVSHRCLAHARCPTVVVR
jgi:nucleotide-binding universal stress UspA family protein